MRFLKKYLLFAFLLENIVVQTSLLGAIANPLFYIFLALGLFCFVDSSIWSKESFQKFGWIYASMGLFVFYEFIIGVDYINTKTLLYLLSRIVIFVIIISGISHNEDFYQGKAIKWLVLTMSFFLLYSLATGGFTETSGRVGGGYTNSNTAGAMGAVIVGMLVFKMKNKKWSFIPLICLFAGMLGVLGGGSRAGFLMLGLLVFMRYGFNLKTIGMGVSLVVLGLFILPAMGIETVGIQRVIDTYSGIEGTNRDVEREAAQWMIAQKPLTGWGFQAVNQSKAAMISQLGAHNGYLEMTKQMGYPCTIAFILIVLSTLIKNIVTVKKKGKALGLFFSIAVVLLVDANYESILIGVHEYITNLFFVSLAMISCRTYALRNVKSSVNN